MWQIFNFFFQIPVCYFITNQICRLLLIWNKNSCFYFNFHSFFLFFLKYLCYKIWLLNNLFKLKQNFKIYKSYFAIEFWSFWKKNYKSFYFNFKSKEFVNSFSYKSNINFVTSNICCCFFKFINTHIKSHELNNYTLEHNITYLKSPVQFETYKIYLV